ncbi:hypothetical protein HD806DRAFT_544970 [Xylariaceae sp. AK1471]|nr:hypothetical protein HD806DRAFT_544970 [Xylariaceae sp. AK1471]
MRSFLNIVFTAQEPHENQHQLSGRHNRPSSLSSAVGLQADACIGKNLMRAPESHHRQMTTELLALGQPIPSSNIGSLFANSTPRALSETVEGQHLRASCQNEPASSLPRDHCEGDAGVDRPVQPRCRSPGRLPSRKPASKKILRAQASKSYSCPGPIDSTNIYEIADVTRKRTGASDKDQYYVLWKGWPPECGTWEDDNPVLEQIFDSKKDPPYYA